MKQMKFLPVWACCIAALSFTSCSNDDSNNSRSLSKEEIAQCLKAVKGDYTGHLIYAAKNENNPKDVTDTLDVEWSITNDSTLTVASFPVKLLAENVTDEELKKALTEADDQPLVCRIGFINTSPIQFLINPKTPAYDLNYGGSDHKVQVPFYINSYNSFGSFNATKNELQMQIIEAGVHVDGQQTTFLKTSVPFVFVSTKKQ